MDPQISQEKQRHDLKILSSPSRAQRRGRLGEIIGRNVLEHEGFTVVDTNWRCSRGEIDIVITDPKTDEIALVEVKTRFSDQWGSGEQSIDGYKLRKLRQLAGIWIEENHPDKTVRIDLLAIDIDEDAPTIDVTHIKRIG